MGHSYIHSSFTLNDFQEGKNVFWTKKFSCSKFIFFFCEKYFANTNENQRFLVASGSADNTVGGNKSSYSSKEVKKAQLLLRQRRKYIIIHYIAVRINSNNQEKL